MVPPLLSYVTFNRLGLTVENLKAILESTDDFEMHIVDSNSADGTWNYIQNLNDSRIKSKIRLTINVGQIYALNMNLAKRKPDQYFITVDNDVYIETRDWISRFMKVFDTFPEVGLLGVQRGHPYPEYLPPVNPRIKNGVFYLEFAGSYPGEEQDFIPGCCQCLRPELIDEIGYWCEENYFCDRELSYRVNNYSSFKSGFVPTISIKIPQTAECGTCRYREKCVLDKSVDTCFSIYAKLYKNDDFFKKYRWKFDETIKDMVKGERPVYCASVFDADSMVNHIFNLEWALENFRFYIDNAN